MFSRKLWAVVAAILVFMGGVGVGVYAAPPASNGIWSGNWIREAYGYFTSGLQLPFTTTGRVLVAGAGGNVSSASAALSDAFNNPERTVTRVVWVSGGTYYSIDGHTGAVTSNADASTLLQAAIDACELVSGTLYIKNGVYTINTQLTVDAPITMIGEGVIWNDGTTGTVLKAGAGITSILHLNSTAPVLGTFRDFTLDGNLQATNCLLLTNAMRVSFENIQCRGATTWGLNDKFDFGHYFKNCKFVANGAHTHAAATPPTKGGAILGTSGGAPVNTAQFDSCYFEFNEGCGLFITSCNGLLFNNCVIEENYSYGVYQGDDNRPILITWNAPYFEHNMINGTKTMSNYFKSGGYVTMNTPYFQETYATSYGGQFDNNKVVLNNLVVPQYATDPVRINGAGCEVSCDLAYISVVATITDFHFKDLNSALIHGWSTTTPAVPASGSNQVNSNFYPVAVYFNSTGTLSAYTIWDTWGQTKTITVAPAPGTMVILGYGDQIQLTYAGAAPKWNWFGLG
jgi:hypothetical protein